MADNASDSDTCSDGNDDDQRARKAVATSSLSSLSSSAPSSSAPSELSSSKKYGYDEWYAHQ